MFSVSDRERIRTRVLDLASSDSRVVAAAVIGSLAHDEGDRWSDIDLTFAVEDGTPIGEVLEDCTSRFVEEFQAVHLLDITSGATLYRVFLLPGCLQLDVSFTPASEFGPKGPKFKLLFGSMAEQLKVEPPSARHFFGYAVHHALRARFCIERGRYWQAEYWISGVRDYALSLACRRRGLPVSHARGFDDLPADVHNALRSALVRSLDRDELLRALAGAVAGLLAEADEVRELAEQVAPQLRELTVRWGSY